MDAKMYVKVSVLNLAFLAAGMGIRGFLDNQVVHAQPNKNGEEITPMMSAGTAAFGTLLAGRFAADQVIIQGVDVGKLQENLLNLLASKPFVGTRAEFQAVIDNARVTPLRMKSEEPASKPQGGKQ